MLLDKGACYSFCPSDLTLVKNYSHIVRFYSILTTNADKDHQVKSLGNVMTGSREVGMGRAISLSL